MIMRPISSFFLFALACTGTASAQNWTGAFDNDWNNPSNWDNWPLNGENITIDPSNFVGAMATPTIANPSDFVPDRLFIEGDAVLTINASVVVADRMIITGPASVVMGGGTFVCDRLVLDAGGTFMLNAGDVVLNNRLALADGDLNGGSRFTQEGGSVSITGELGFECEAGLFEPTYELKAGTLLVNGDVVWFGAAPGGGRPRWIVNGGSAQINGSVLNDAGNTVDLFVSLASGSIITNGPEIQLLNTTDSILQTGGTWRVDNDALIDNDGVWLANDGVVHFDQRTELRGNGSFQFHDLSISTGAMLQHRDPAEIGVTGDWTNLGSFDPDVNSVVFHGSDLQTVGATSFHGVHMNNSGTGVGLAGPSTIGGELVMENGNIQSHLNDLLTLLHNATATSGSQTSYVEGPMRKIGNDAFAFPIGKNGQWRRLGIGALNDQNTEFTAEYFDSGYSNTASIAASLSSVSSSDYWSLVRSATMDETQVELFWEDAMSSGFSDCSALRLARWDGSTWQAESTTISGSCSGNDAGSLESDDVVVTYNAFTTGTTNSIISINELNQVNELRTHPQPADQWTTIPVLQPGMEFELLDAMGRKRHVGSSRTSEGITIRTGELATGMYSVLLSFEGGLIARSRILVVH
jgi:hypothetical protein